MSPLTEGTSYWMASTPTTSYPPLEHGIDVDVCIVGGGLTGLLTAWELTDVGRTVAVLERNRIAESVTGYTTAKLTSQHGLKYHRIEQSRGTSAAATYGEANERAMRRITQLAEQLDIDADMQQRTAYVYSTRPDDAASLQEEAASAARAGHPASYTPDVPVPFPTGGVRFEDQLEFHPRKLLLGLAAALRSRGGRIFEDMKATGIEPGTPCVVTSEGGACVHAADVVVRRCCHQALAATSSSTCSATMGMP